LHGHACATAILGNRQAMMPTSRRFDIANQDLQVPLTILAASNEGRIQARVDRRCRRFQLGRGSILKRLASLPGVTA
jgi:hypothetical protein